VFLEFLSGFLIQAPNEHRRKQLLNKTLELGLKRSNKTRKINPTRWVKNKEYISHLPPTRGKSHNFHEKTHSRPYFGYCWQKYCPPALITPNSGMGNPTLRTEFSFTSIYMLTGDRKNEENLHNVAKKVTHLGPLFYSQISILPRFLIFARKSKIFFFSIYLPILFYRIYKKQNNLNFTHKIQFFINPTNSNYTVPCF
jgi:hypothetical protein